MNFMNPYAQWAGNNGAPFGDPPTRGALPPANLESGTILTFCLPYPVLSGNVTGPGQKVYFTIQTTAEATTIFQREEPISRIHWSNPTMVEARGVPASRPASQFLALSSDRKYRTMVLGNKRYYWTPYSDGTYLFDGPPGQIMNQRYAKMQAIPVSRPTTVTLEISSDAVHNGLLEPCILAALLLWGGRNID
ncbi:hypothetical protein CVT26_005261 [Gymnopilus dilepis]|uniref:Uncharacterized protein n=1 Tax=Gymnopilus dilepis TaxID=231916 RepID=A0A409YVM9_9AGAR|nr:hypothetical protein CVT26_005261 [Gymnopilus dilepis]